MPAALPVTLENMNYASVVFVAGVFFSGAWYAIRGRKTYQGPPLPVESVDRRRSSEVRGPVTTF
jgi:hypothetical protein